jgi:integrase
MFTAHKIGTLLPPSINGILNATLGFARWLAENPQFIPQERCFEWSDLTADIFSEWVKAEHSNKRKGDYARVVRSFYLWCADSEAHYSNFSKDVAKAITQISLQSRTAGEVVESRDKRRGPFTREELELILEACEAGKGDDRDRAITWTLLCTAVRPQQLVLLRRRDLQIFNQADESRSDNLLSFQHPFSN